ncbi:MAG: hypothetical protein KC547_18540, partial [Anaerolineae bacterium]|nr:hypothetical protein [Anaerolineae bacterium]
NIRFEHVFSLPDGTVHLKSSARGDGFVLRFPGNADFWIDADQRLIAAYPFAGVSNDALAHLLLDQVLPRLLSHLGQLALHASGVVIEDQAVIFLGESGLGKSTLAAEFHFNGFRGFADDTVFMEKIDGGFVAGPAYAGFRLWPDSARNYALLSASLPPVSLIHGKRRLVLRTDDVIDIPLPLRAIYVLTAPDAIDTDIFIDAIAPKDAFWTLMRYIFRLVVPDRDQMSRDLSVVGELADSVPCFSLKYPREYNQLPVLRQRLLEHGTSLRA